MYIHTHTHERGQKHKGVRHMTYRNSTSSVWKEGTEAKLHPRLLLSRKPLQLGSFLIVLKQSWKGTFAAAPKLSVFPFLLCYSILPFFRRIVNTHTQHHMDSLITPPVSHLDLRMANSLSVTEFPKQHNLILTERAWCFCLSWATLCTDLCMMFAKHQQDCIEWDTLFLSEPTLLSCILSSTLGLTSAPRRKPPPSVTLLCIRRLYKPFGSIFLARQLVPLPLLTTAVWQLLKMAFSLPGT